MDFSPCANHYAEYSIWIVSLSHKKPSKVGSIIFILHIRISYAERLSHSTWKLELGFNPRLSEPRDQALYSNAKKVIVLIKSPGLQSRVLLFLTAIVFSDP